MLFGREGADNDSTTSIDDQNPENDGSVDAHDFHIPTLIFNLSSFSARELLACITRCMLKSHVTF